MHEKAVALKGAIQELYTSAAALHVPVHTLIGTELQWDINFSWLKDISPKACIISVTMVFAFLVFLKQILFYILGVTLKKCDIAPV